VREYDSEQKHAATLHVKLQIQEWMQIYFKTDANPRPDADSRPDAKGCAFRRKATAGTAATLKRG
jgi:hypothetical protein